MEQITRDYFGQIMLQLETLFQNFQEKELKCRICIEKITFKQYYIELNVLIRKPCYIFKEIYIFESLKLNGLKEK